MQTNTSTKSQAVSVNRNAALTVKDITKSFDGNQVLGGISVHIDSGETVAVMGPSGSGKSTLLHCMSGILTPDSGEVSLGQTNLSKLSDAKRSQARLGQMGFVFQDHQLLPELTAQENAALPAILRGQSRSTAMKNAGAALEQLGIGELANRRPGKMSGGQAQRVAIARAIADRPAVLFADEPTGALDQATGHAVMQQLTAIARQHRITLVMVTHDVNVANWCNRRLEIRDGLIHDDRKVR